MLIPYEPPSDWKSFLKRKDNIGLPIMEVKQKYLKEQLLYESYMQQLNTVSTLSSGAAGGPPRFFPAEYLWYPQYNGFGAIPRTQKVFKSPITFNGSSVHVAEFDFEDSSIGDRAYYFIFFDIIGAPNNPPGAGEIDGWNKVAVGDEDGDDLPWRTMSTAQLEAFLLQSLDYSTPIYRSTNGAVTPQNPESPLGIYDRLPGDGQQDALTPLGVNRVESGALIYGT
tara:strand:- start:437 stop:1111 length:675 start_codon:yes stop_codon:yes gene_type:complete